MVLLTFIFKINASAWIYDVRACMRTCVYVDGEKLLWVRKSGSQLCDIFLY